MADNSYRARKKAAGNRGAGGAVSVTTGDSLAAEKIERRIAEQEDWRGEWLALDRRLIHEADPAVVEDWKWKGTPVWSHEGMYVNANAFKDKVKLTFFHGAQLSDPSNLFNNGLDGNKWRAIDIREGDSIDGTRSRRCCGRRWPYNTEHSVPKSKGSRDV